ncbi:MAG: DUF4233 domain-containing protein [Nakamurella sp.]
MTAEPTPADGSGSVPGSGPAVPGSESAVPGFVPQPQPQPQPQPEPEPRPYDPERGLRGVMSATLILEAIVVLLSIPVARNTGAGWSSVVLICSLSAALIALCAFVSRSWFLPFALALQGLMILGWLITASLGVMGIVFGAVWALIIWFRNEFRRRLAAGTLPEPGPPAGR